ncbi:MAG: hypothetical protein A2381_11580 [Bdellovibrionales bacterium RIFOXYB1_FULL_37_110]|nr:MAG: hypothetical protein A2417_11885 [Bdellovibrionales bacterium RIFOXYC1_FULL_37_79]OFZ57331.1 MAG: hypothetical protein A2381_11580 [Bdellovibrionales bacterium RIFOXYB1_FULL_37_110]OFZ62227.1 MAG: hypothetical protein A2577_14130 [Bdellovibrionales bacterium RIFOXYD1_FULL_36_51]
MSKTEAERLVTDLKTIAHHAEQVLMSSAETAGEKVHNVKEKLLTTFDSTKASLKSMENHAIHAAKTTDVHIRKHPYQSIGIALGVGTLLGAIAARHQAQ